MFAKRLLEKVANLSPRASSSSQNEKIRSVAESDLDPRLVAHYGIPSTASILAFDPIQRLLAIGTTEGRIKVIGRDGIEGILTSPKQSPYKNLEFLHNKGFLVSISNENNIQVWDLEYMHRACSLKWDSNITAFTAVNGTYFMYVGDEWGLISVLKYNVEDKKLFQLPYHIPINCLAETAGVSVTYPQSVVGLIPQSFTSDNRVVIAYEKGLIILWDISEARVVLIRGDKYLQMRNIRVFGSPEELSNKIPDDKDKHKIEDKEISSICWASSDESVLAVGYVDGDIMLWNMSVSSKKVQESEEPSNNVVKLQLSSSEKRLPVIAIHWSASCKSDHGSGGQLFIYGGDETGSEEVLTVLRLEWPSGIETLHCISRTDLILKGSFSDLILVPNAGEMNNHSNTLFVLTKPGHLDVYEDSILSSLSSHKEKMPVHSNPLPVLVPTVAPCLTVAKLSLIPTDGSSSKTLLEMASVKKTTVTPCQTTGSKGTMPGGVSSQSSTSKDHQVDRLYMAGYEDGSVKIWDATYPVLSLIFVLESEVENSKVAGANASVSALDFCPHTLSLAVGNDSGLVRVYKLSGNSGETELHSLFESKHEVSRVYQEKGLQCAAVFAVLNSTVQTLQYANSGAKLAIGFTCGQVGMLDMCSLSVLFLTDSMFGSKSPVISLIEKESLDINNIINSPKHQETKAKDPANVLFCLCRDSCMFIMDCVTGNMISSRSILQKKGSASISLYIIESSSSVSEASKESFQDQLSLKSPTKRDSKKENNLNEDAPKESTLSASGESTSSDKCSLDSLVLLCCEDALHLFSLKSLVKGDTNSVCKVSLAKPCCWTTTFKRKDEKACGLALFYQTGIIEIRSLPNLEVVSEISLASILRWSFMAKMEKTICSLDNGQISLINGSELAFISLLAFENEFRTPDSLPAFHDKVLAEAANAAINLSNQKKQSTSSGLFGGLIKGIKGEKPKCDGDLAEHFEIIFSKPPFPDPSETIDDVLELNIDDIEIAGPILVTSTGSNQGKNDKRDKEKEREKLFQGATSDTKPRMRDPEEIKAKYRKAGDVSAVASQAKDKLIERKEKLERLVRNTEELQSGSENFASMANELVKAMEAKKWWQL